MSSQSAYLQSLLPDNGFQRRRYFNFRAHVLTGRDCLTTNKILDLSCLSHLGTDSIENTASNSYSIVGSRSCHTDHVENTASKLVYWCVVGSVA
jgi:hypothetical protein